VLVDKGDFAAGASSTSSRMIHGGLRYLENAELALVKEAVTDRNRLLRDAPHYVAAAQDDDSDQVVVLAGLIKSPMVFFRLPVTPGGRGAAIVKMGLMTYDILTRKNRRTPRHFFTSRDKSLAEMPGLVDDIACTATYWDAWISQTERLCVDMIAEACRENPECVAMNYVSARKDGGDSVVLQDPAQRRGDCDQARRWWSTRPAPGWIMRMRRWASSRSSWAAPRARTWWWTTRSCSKRSATG
jgi:glycerol-3-phosphate dehydrogenase